MLGFAVGAGLLACHGGAASSSPEGWSQTERARIVAMSPLPALPESPSNAVADDPAAAALGEALFHDPGFSANGQVSCATCHRPELYFTDGQAKATGLSETPRHAPGFVGAQWNKWFYWDGRKDSLWSQALAPPESPGEHGFSRLEVVHRLASDYAEPYAALFGELPELAELPARAMPRAGHIDSDEHLAWLAMSPEQQGAIDRAYSNFGKAIAAFERTQLPTEAPIDRYVAALERGDPTGGGHLTDAQLQGLALFVGPANCVSCHHGALFTDGAFHNLGLPVDPSRSMDLGRAVGVGQVLSDPFNCDGDFSDAESCPELRYVDPAFPDFMMAFKTPSLRNVAETAPYMHDGSLPDLPSVLAFYQVLPGEPVLGHRELTLEPLDLKPDEIAALQAFLGALTGPAPTGPT